MKQTITIIGTLHAGFTPEAELRAIIERYRPDLVLVEIVQEDIDSRNISDYPPEMVFAYRWAVENGVSVKGFDSKIDTFRGGFSKERNDEIVRKQGEIIAKHDWKDFNRPEIDGLLDIRELADSIDPELEAEREALMLKNIRESIGDASAVLVLAGCGHLDFLEKAMPDAVLPLRYDVKEGR
ncbi:MAG: hypothetical protein HGB34_03755 [Candidatus Moranbacteria bacterium]|nr:hypothetical protein [Candidatus Moranbacteria bacterium]